MLTFSLMALISLFQLVNSDGNIERYEIAKLFENGEYSKSFSQLLLTSSEEDKGNCSHVLTVCSTETEGVCVCVWLIANSTPIPRGWHLLQ